MTASESADHAHDTGLGWPCSADSEAWQEPAGQVIGLGWPAEQETG